MDVFITFGTVDFHPPIELQQPLTDRDKDKILLLSFDLLFSGLVIQTKSHQVRLVLS